MAKQLVKTCIKTSEEARDLLRYSITYISHHLHHLHFFFVLSYFVQRLGADDCLVLYVLVTEKITYIYSTFVSFRYENLKTEISKEHHRNHGFLNFMGTLKKKTPKAASEKKCEF